MSVERDEYWMNYALNLAKASEEAGEVPVGAVLVLDDHVIGEGHNQPISTVDATAHAEIMALRKGAATINNYRLLNTTLYVTLEPCVMCFGAMIHARIKRLVFGAFDPKSGAVQSQFQLGAASSGFNHQIEILGGVLQERCGAILTQFFKKKRANF